MCKSKAGYWPSCANISRLTCGARDLYSGEGALFEFCFGAQPIVMRVALGTTALDPVRISESGDSFAGKGFGRSHGLFSDSHSRLGGDWFDHFYYDRFDHFGDNRFGDGQLR